MTAQRPGIADALEKQASARRGFIRAYGMFWSAEEVDWWGAAGLSRLELLGRVNKNKNALRLVNFWEQQGIYVLYNDHGPYYVGQTFGQSLGIRLRQHQKKDSPHLGRWNRFSWFGWRRVLKSAEGDGVLKLGAVPQKVLADSKDTVKDIEALLIEALGTRWVGNARSELFAAALKWEQVLWHERDMYIARAQG